MGDCYRAVKAFLTPTATGNLDVTDATALNGKTPKGAIVVFTGHLDSNGNTPTADYHMAVGFYDGTTQVSYASFSDNGTASTSTFKRANGTHVIDNALVVASASFIANGIRLNFTTVAATAFRGYVILFAGDDVDCAVQELSLGASGSPTFDITVGFTPDLVFVAGSGNTAATTVTNDANFTFGVALASGGLRGLAHVEDHNQANGGPAVYMFSNRAGGMLLENNGNRSYGINVNSFDATGFTILADANAGTERVGFLAVRQTGVSYFLTDYATPTVTGVVSYSVGSPAFQPDLGLIISSQVVALDTVTFDVEAANSIGISAFSDTSGGIIAEAAAGRMVFNADPTQTSHVQRHSTAALVGNSAGIANIIATLSGFDSQGWDLNYSAVDATARKAVMLAMGDSVTTTEARVTQSVALVRVKGTPASRITQSVALVRVKLQKPACDTAEADLWRIERTDGTVYCFTSHDRPMTFRGERYEPCGSLTASALQLSAELGSTDNVDLSGVIYEGGINELDLWSGRFVGAEVEIWRSAWDGSTAPVLITAGVVGNTKFEDQPFTFEIITAGERLTQRALLQPVMPTCRFKTFDSRCSLVAADFDVTGSVTSIAGNNLFSGNARRAFFDSTRTEVDGYFTRGKITWTSGDNIGQTADVKQYAQADGAFILETRLQYPLQVGDTYTLLPGDDHTFETCRDKFNNAINFGGFPAVKGNDDLSAEGRPDGSGLDVRNIVNGLVS